MHASSLEDLFVYRKAADVSDAVSALLKRPALIKDRRLHEQLGASSERVGSLISEGFGQSTDRHFAEYLYRSRGSCKEVRNQLRVALARGYISAEERMALASRYVEIEKMLTSLIRHLKMEDRQDRL
jgi:four helix bundle protein